LERKTFVVQVALDLGAKRSQVNVSVLKVQDFFTYHVTPSLAISG
jgi:hypothetical protein